MSDPSSAAHTPTTLASSPQNKVANRETRSKCASSASCRTKRRYQSMIVAVVNAESSPELADIAAAMMAAMSRPAMPIGMRVVMNVGKT